MYRAPSRRRQLIVRTLVYVVMTLAVAVLVTFLVFVMLGYRFNRDTSTIEQGGLVQFASRPIDANVTIGTAKLTDLTPSKITVNPGSYPVTISRNGYQPWSKNVEVHSGQVLWLNYAQLVPKKIATRSLMTIDSLDGVKSSPNGDRYVLIPDKTKPELLFVDISGDAPVRTEIILPAGMVPSAKKITLGLGDWASDSDHLIVTLKHDGVTEYLYVDRRDAKKTINLSTQYESGIVEAVFDPRSNDRVIIRTTKGEIRVIDVANGSLSQVVASSVKSMSMYGNDAIILVQSVDKTTQTVGYISFGSKKVRELKKVASSETTRAAAASYFSAPYLAIATGSKFEVYKIRSLPSSDSDGSISMSSLYTTTLPANPDYVSIRSNGRFVLAQYGSGLLTYDLELSKQSLTSFQKPLAGELRWLDRYHFYTTNGSHLEVLEFDGANAHQIVELTTQFDAVQSDDGKYIYTINQTDDKKFALVRSQMILDN